MREQNGIFIGLNAGCHTRQHFIHGLYHLLALVFLVLGGVAYTVGVIFYRQKEKPYRHGIWHFFVLAGTTLHFFTVYLSCCG